jgi:hypothetical protein
MCLPQLRIKVMINRTAFMRKQCVLNEICKNHTKILVGDFNAKAGRKHILKPRTGNKST